MLDAHICRHALYADIAPGANQTFQVLACAPCGGQRVHLLCDYGLAEVCLCCGLATEHVDRAGNDQERA